MIDRATLSAGDRYLMDRHALAMRERREQNRRAKRCINASISGRGQVSHEGEFDGSGRCPHCRECHRRSK